MPVSKKQIRKPLPEKCVDPVRDCPAQMMADEIAILSTSLQLHVQNLEGMVGKIEEVVERADKVLFGNGSPGIVMRIDRIEQAELRREKTQETARKVAIGIIVGLAIQTLMVIAGSVYWLVQFFARHQPVG